MLTSRRRGLTLIELLVVMIILIALAGLLIPMLSGTTQDAQATVTRTNLQDLANVIGRYRADTGLFPGPVGSPSPPPQLNALFVNPGLPPYNPSSKTGWNGPYVLGGAGSYPDPANAHVIAQGFTATFGMKNDPCVLDGWLNPLVLIQFTDTSGVTHAWLQSAGPDGMLAVAYASSGGLTVTGKDMGGAPITAATVTGPPASSATHSSHSPAVTSSSQFPTSSGYVVVDDLTYVVQ